MSDDARPHEIIIIKRHAGLHEDHHHGGVWKIAYADFVTAMMAFFLVMWLISANDKTKAVIARYFNPVQLVDSTPQPPGLNDPKDRVTAVSKAGATKPGTDGRDLPPTAAPEVKTPTSPAPEVKTPTSPAAEVKTLASSETEAKTHEAALFKDPAAALNEIAAKDAATVSTAPVPGKPQVEGPKSPAAGGSVRGGDAFRDPFAPMSPTASGDAADPAQAAAFPAPSPPSPAVDPLPPAAATPLPVDPQARAAELKSRIDEVMKAAAASGASAGPRLEVKATAEGTLISLADDAKFAMFASASAEPSPRLVVLMGKIGRILKDQKGKVVIRGFTDGRKFKSETYDNWRLSSARAHMAHYMLVRGGLDEARVDRIEGYADRQPRDPKNPDSPENRRIEILVREP